MPEVTTLGRTKYLANTMENAHKFIKGTSRYRQRYRSFDTARNSISAMETMRMVQKGK